LKASSEHHSKRLYLLTGDESILVNPFATLLCFVLAASSGALFAQSKQSAQEVFTQFETLRGEVVDVNGNRIPKCSVNVSLSDTIEVDKLRDKTKSLGRWAAKDTAGEFSFDTEQPISINFNTRLICRVSAQGYLPASKNLYRRSDLAIFDGNFGKITLKRPVNVTGRIVMPASSAAEPLRQPKASVRLITNPRARASEFHEPVPVAKDGSFELTLPESSQVEIVAYSQNAAAISKTVQIEKFDPNSDRQELGEIQLVEGVAVSGVVLTRDGTPVENQLVSLSQVLAGQYIHATAITDVLGEFELAPRLGEVVIKLNEEFSNDGKATNSAGRKLTARPVNLTLRQGVEVKPIEFREVESFLITGSVALENGHVPDSVYVAASNNFDNRQVRKDVGKDGTFAFAVAQGVKVSLIIAYDGDDRETGFVSSLKSDSLNQNRNAFSNYKDEEQSFHLKPIQENIGPLDFILQEHIPEHSTATEEVFNWILGK
jgi:hypothetical protein